MWKVVIVDDDDKVLRGMRNIIPWEELSCEWVGEARNGEEGHHVIMDLEPDLVITDIYMPVMNGLEMIEQVRASGLETRVIILSGYNEFEYARQAMRLSIDDYLSKPASPDTIKDVLISCVDSLEKEAVKQMEVSELRERVALYEPLVEKEWVKAVITGTTTHLTNLPLTLDQLTRRWSQQQHVIMTISYDQSLEASSLYKSGWYLFRFATENVINDAVNKYIDDSHYIELHSHQTALCLHINQTKGKVNDELLNHIKHDIVTKLDTYFKLKVRVGFGCFKNEWADMAISLKEALMDIDQKAQEGTGLYNESMFNEETKLNSKSLWLDSIENIHRLSEAIRYADKASAQHVIQATYFYYKDHPFNMSEVMRAGIEMWTIMTYSLYDIGIKIDEMFSDTFDFHSGLTKLSHWKEFKDYMNDLISHICDHQQWDENLKHRQLIEQMLDYIHKNISKNITLQDIANELYISRNYLGQIFKKVVGESFKNYLTRVRMEKAKKMIQEGDHLIYEISEKVGFINPAYFTTTFKKYTGYTPTELINRKLMAAHEQTVQDA
ncbi:response regulator transcription factor [Salipaludibacillus agaradhaerens]|uniref:Response regulator transcription factor n=1 Tax=Salipaludibacillus agaradhaerens TaxID=76935 RepID=A0A9Q4AYY8_SALAG|nr:response regulator transcription factor [Salipaludibacillus agaradhaerens]MCR6095362.1 response regulator transcription factor [Salipaludibacillus agaradhaerens]MCR6115080.1 response regulator transcription factor [Salipaludibacillus agaradhaerens]